MFKALEPSESELEALKGAGSQLPGSSRAYRDVREDVMSVSVKMDARRARDWTSEDEDRLRTMSWWVGDSHAASGLRFFSPYITNATAKHRHPESALLFGNSWVSQSKNVIRLLHSDDVIDHRKRDRGRVPGALPQYLLEIPGTDVWILRRGLVEKTLSDQMEEWETIRPVLYGHASAALRPQSVEARLRLLTELAQALERFHRAGRIHGDLRPANVALGKHVLLLDYGVRRDAHELFPEELIYRAPESESVRPDAAADVYAFGKIAQRLRGSFLWADNEIGGWRASELEWVIQTCMLTDPGRRPPMSVVARIFDDGTSYLAPSVRRAQRAVRKSLETWLIDLGFGEIATSEIVHDSNEKVREYAAQHPATRSMLTDFTALESLTKRIAIDGSERLRQNLTRSETKHEALAAMGEGLLSDPPQTPDEVWRNRLHVLNFDFPIDAGHDDRMAREGDNPELARETERYRKQLALVTAARNELLQRDTYLYTAGVADLLTRSGLPTSEADVTILREWGYLLAVEDHGRRLYPAFQFDDSAMPRRIIREVNHRFNGAEPWDVLMWWRNPRISLEGASYADNLSAENGEEVVLEALERLGR